MSDPEVNAKVEIPKIDNWPGTIKAYRTVRPYIKPQIWNFISIIGLTIAVLIIIEIIIAIIFRHTIANVVANYIADLFAGAFFQAIALTMYFKSLNNDEFTLAEVILYGYRRLLKMFGLVLVMYVVLIVSFVLLIVPFLIILPRIYLAPYFLIYNDSSVSEALAASWHLTKGHLTKVYGILLLDAAISLLVLTVIGIPFAVYWWLINTGSFALLAMYLTQPKKADKTKPFNKAIAAS